MEGRKECKGRKEGRKGKEGQEEGKEGRMDGRNKGRKATVQGALCFKAEHLDD